MRSRQTGTDALLVQARVERLAGDDAARGSAPDGSPLVAVQRARPIALEIDGQRLAWRSHAQTVEGALAEAGFSMGPFDTVTLNGIPLGPRDRIDVPPELIASRALSVRLPPAAAGPGDAAGSTLAVARALPFTVIDGDTRIELASGEATVGLALRQRGIPIGPGDLVDPPPGEPLVAGMEVVVERAQPVTVSMGSSRVLLYTRASTIGDALREAGVTLAADQRAYPPPEMVISGGEDVRVVTVSDETYIESGTVSHGAVYRIDSSLGDGETRRVLGSDGTLYQAFRIDYEDGQEVYRELVHEWYDPAPVDTVIYYAGDERVVAAGIPEDLDVVRTLRVYATWYNPASAGRPPSSPAYGITATGVPVTYGIVAVDPSVIPLGTRMYIPGYGYAVAADTGGAIVGHIIDLGYPDGVDPDWVSGWIEIYILGP